MSTALPLQFSELLADGALRAAQLVALLFALNAAQPAHAQLPREATAQLPPVTVTAPAIVDIDTGIDGSPLTLVANHVDIRVAGTQARVRTTLTWRNDGLAPVQARYRAPLPSTLVRLVEDDDLDGCGDAVDALMAAAMDDERREAADPGAATGAGTVLVTLAPGEEVRVTAEREATLIVRGDHHRIVLPLYTQRQALFAPRFSATASIDAARPIVDLGSATHPVEIAVLGESQAQVVIPDSRVHEGQFLALDYTLGQPAQAAGARVATAPHWGGEAQARVATR